jgi:hypothetical protein
MVAEAFREPGERMPIAVGVAGGVSDSGSPVNLARGARAETPLFPIVSLCLLLSGVVAWIARGGCFRRQTPIAKVVSVALGGILLVIFVRVANNALFDRSDVGIAPTGTSNS